MRRCFLIPFLFSLIIPASVAEEIEKYIVIGNDKYATDGDRLLYSPQRLASAADAVAAINNLEAQFTVWDGYPTRELKVTRERMRVHGVHEGSGVEEQWVSTGLLSGYYDKTVVPYRNEQTAIVPFGQVANISLWHFPKTGRENKWEVEVAIEGSQPVSFRAKSLADATTLANAIATLAASHGRTQPPQLGINPIHKDPKKEQKTRKKLDWPDDTGAVVAGVLKGSPAAEAGIRKNDIILALNGLEVADSASYLRLISDLKPAEGANYDLPVTYFRDGQTLNAQLKFPNPNFSIAHLAATAGKDQPAPAARPPFGIAVRNSGDATDAAAQGLVIVRVIEGSPAEKMQIRADDILLEVNGKPIVTTEQLRQVLSGDDIATVKVRRDGQEFVLEALVVL